jgi:hypothetical protein
MRKKKTFDCVEMKRHIQEKIYNETRNMNHEELVQYYHDRIAKSQFAEFLNIPASNKRI